jgi:type IV fimbrial biogenesis protein FimT
MTNKVSNLKGFTLIELMVTLSIAAILMMIAVPSLETYRRNSELTSATNTLLAAINAARGEAMKRGMRAMVVPIGNDNNWNAGWVVFVDSDGTQDFLATQDFTVLTQAQLPNYINVVGNGTANLGRAYIMFDPSGYSRTKTGGFNNLTINLARTDVPATSQASETRRIMILNTGRVRTCKPTSATDTNCLANPSSTQY